MKPQKKAGTPPLTACSCFCLCRARRAKRREKFGDEAADFFTPALVPACGLHPYFDPAAWAASQPRRKKMKPFFCGFGLVRVRRHRIRPGGGVLRRTSRRRPQKKRRGLSLVPVLDADQNPALSLGFCQHRAGQCQVKIESQNQNRRHFDHRAFRSSQASATNPADHSSG